MKIKETRTVPRGGLTRQLPPKTQSRVVEVEIAPQGSQQTTEDVRDWQDDTEVQK